METHSSSTHSLASDVSASATFIPKPPDGPKPVRKDPKRRSRVASSPYLANVKQPKATSSLKNTSTIVGSDVGSTWKSFDEVVRAAATQQAATSAFLRSLHKSKSVEGIDAVKRRRRINSGELAISGQPAGPAAEYSKSCEDMYDEIVELKKALNAVTSERDLARSKVVQLDKLLLKRDKQVEDMLAAGYVGNHEITRTLAGGKKIDTTVLSSLKQKVHVLERTLREKEATINKFSANMKVSRVEEAELKAETYYYEVCRLKEIFRKQNGEVEEMLSLSLVGDVTSRLSTLNAAVIKLSEQKKKLQSNKKILEEKLKQCTAKIEHGETGIRGPIADQYADQQRAEMLSRIVDLELEMKEKENTITSLCKEFEEKQLQYEEKIAGLVSNLNESNSQSNVIHFQLSEAEKSRDKFKNHLKQMKNDKNYYREQEKSKSQEVEEARAALHVQSASVELLQNQLKELQEQLNNEEKAREHARMLKWKRAQTLTSSRARRHEAASVIQEHWKRSQSMKRQKKYEDDLNEDVTFVQSAIKAHLYQKQYLQDHQTSEVGSTSGQEYHRASISEDVLDQKDEDNISTVEAIEIIQSTLRGHLTRQDIINKDLSELPEKQLSHDIIGQASYSDSVNMWRHDTSSLPVYVENIMNTEHACENKHRKRMDKSSIQQSPSYQIKNPINHPSSFQYNMSSSGDEEDFEIAGMHKSISYDSIIEIVGPHSESAEVVNSHHYKEMLILSDEL